MKEIKEKEKNDNQYININSNEYKIIYCSQCNLYIIYNREIKESSPSSHIRCDNCSNPNLQNVFIDEAKIYFDSATCTRKTTFIRGNPSFIKRRHYSWKIIQNMDSPE